MGEERTPDQTGTEARRARLPDASESWGAFAWGLHGASVCLFLLMLSGSIEQALLVLLAAQLMALLLGLAGKAWRSQSRLRAPATACMYAFAALWVSVDLSAVRYRDLSSAEKAEWWTAHDIRTADSSGAPDWQSTAVVAGFPIRGLQGHDQERLFREWHAAQDGRGIIGPGFRGPLIPHIPLDRGAWVLWLDYLLWVMPLWWALSRLPPLRSFVSYATAILVVLTGLAFCGLWTSTNAFD